MGLGEDIPALLSVIDDVMQLLSSGNNTVDHGVLLHKIKMLGIKGKFGSRLYHFLEPILLGYEEVLALTVR